MQCLHIYCKSSSGPRGELKAINLVHSEDEFKSASPKSQKDPPESLGKLFRISFNNCSDLKYQSKSKRGWDDILTLRLEFVVYITVRTGDF